MITTKQYLEKIKLTRADKAEYYDYSKVNYTGSANKIIIVCPSHGQFEQFANDHRAGIGCKKCGRENAKVTNLAKYGTENPASSKVVKDKIKNKLIEMYGVDNPSKVEAIKKQKQETCFRNYGVAHPHQAQQIKENTKNTNLAIYGCTSPMGNKEISKKATASKIARGGFTKSNSSKEATQFIKKYIQNKEYHIDQCAYADPELGLHEWGIYKNGRWILYDLVVFEFGFRGNKEHIIEILEYHGPFHYTINDVELRGDANAYPWKTNKTTIRESVNRDCEKELIAKEFTNNFTVVWGRDV